MIDRLKDLVHYICAQATTEGGGWRFAKLNQVLYYSDALHYVAHGKSISGAVYIRQEFGPVAFEILTILEQLEDEGNLSVANKEIYGYSDQQYFSLRTPNTTYFTGKHLTIIDQVLVKQSTLSTSFETFTHIWDAAAIREEIPYSTVFVQPLAEVNENVIEWGRNMQDKPVTDQIKSIKEQLSYLMNRVEADNYNFGFGVVIELLHQGYGLQREGWSGKDLFIFKQTPAQIGADIIPKMQSVPDQVKEKILDRELPQMNYTHQLCIVHPGGRVDSWVPSVSDIFAVDWLIVD